MRNDITKQWILIDAKTRLIPKSETLSNSCLDNKKEL